MSVLEAAVNIAIGVVGSLAILLSVAAARDAFVSRRRGRRQGGQPAPGMPAR
jgi:hypothetical protein